jgi:hypothetical protein
MKVRCSIALLALSTAAMDSEAGPFRRRAQPTYQTPTYYQPTAPATTYTAHYTPASDIVSDAVPLSSSAAAGDGLDEVNAKRAARGLRPFVRDEGLTQAAHACAAFRAARGMFGHTSNDFNFCPAGVSASSAGCAAYPASYGWMSCCVYDNYTYGGAAWVTGADGRRFMQLFVR